ncbi:MAG: 1-deoxy-D-xylulose-5-phosphate synthase [Pseudomonadales bacterium]|nr:1-deoxy-D-xylulose-5-phosphate synthase [Pseudomonadales bacterium]
MRNNNYALLRTIDSPEDLRALPEQELERVADELRAYLIDSIAACGGHFAAGLGTVELAIALHYVFNTPADKLIWDVGHQAYPHKILTGRRDRIHTIRKQGGLTPFLKNSESPYDAFGAGHSSTSISAAVGMAMAARAQQLNQTAIAVIGDGGITAGLAYEAMNHAGSLADLDLLVILNDNQMSISPNVGAMHNYLTRILSGRVYNKVLSRGERLLKNSMPTLLKLARHMKKQVRDLVAPPGSLFDELGFAYFGPIDGHDLPTLMHTLKNLKSVSGPRLLHVITCKGNGYAQAEDDPVKYHGVSPFDPRLGILPVNAKHVPAPSYSQIFGKWLCDMAAADKRLIGITPAMREGSGMVEFAEQYPSQYVDVGIAEQHSVTLAAGMATQGMKPVVAIYSSFLQRAYDQVVHDVAIPGLPVLFAIDRAGLVGPDGPTHAGSYDFTYLRALPGMVIMAPADENECRQMLYTGYQLDQPAAVRYPRGGGPGVAVDEPMRALPLGTAQWVREGVNIALLAFGAMLAPARAVAEDMNATVINMRFVKPLDTALIDTIAATHQVIVTLEENVVPGGAGEAVHEYLSTQGVCIPILHIGLPDRFIEHGSREQMLTDAGLDQQGIAGTIAEFLDRIDQPGLGAKPGMTKRKNGTGTSRLTQIGY